MRRLLAGVLAACGLLASLGMAKVPWEHGKLVSVGNAPFNQLAIQRSDGALLTILPSDETGALDKRQLAPFAARAGDKVRFRALRSAQSKLSGEMVVLSQMELER
ncbi:hypothetical protein [Chromobacterium subtsugae]|uniref:hypothetical protein n=1 Tax=Chromobacterium subtsugae TaxID=251747 RepID=UPI000A8181FE|nr:hypothetical protein [Chromobacterium subtsugae]